jgi:predicted Zn finger-like uncharacterized protein
MGFLDMRAEIGNLDGEIARASDSVVMILTCPECATGYFVQDDQIQASGRTVRCAACGNRWTAYPEKPLELVASEEEGALAKAPADDQAGLLEPGSLTGDELPRAFRNRAEEERRNRQAAVTGAAWTGIALLVVAVLGAGAVFREQIVRAWPQTASIYATLGMPVNPTGLVLEHLQVQPSLEGSHPAYVVTGTIRNVVGRSVLAPPVRITLLNAQGKRVAGQITDWTDRRVPAGAMRRFRTAILDPPFSAITLSVDFAIGGRATAGDMQTTGPDQPLATSIPLRGPAGEPAAVNATPLPDGPLPNGPLPAAPAAPTAEAPVAVAPAPAANAASPAAR